MVEGAKRAHLSSMLGKLTTTAVPRAFGERVHVRFDHGGEPLASQAYRRVRQLFLSRFNV